MSSTEKPSEGELLDVRQAAASVDRHPETIRRRIWAGKLPASRRGNRLLVRREDLESEFGETKKPLTLAEWAERVRAFHERNAAERASKGFKSSESAADMIREDREERARRLLELADR